MPRPTDYKVLPIHPLPKTQCLNTSTFCQPALDGSLSMPEIYDHHLTKSPDHALFLYSDEQGNVTRINWPEGVRAVHRVGWIVRSLAGDITPQREKPKIFAILAASDTITYFTMMTGIIRAGHTVFPISPRNSASAVAHLLSKTGAHHVFVGPERSLHDLAAASFKIMADTGTPHPRITTVPAFESLYPKDADASFEFLPPFKPDWDDPAVVMHSSGSTAFPKPIVWSHYTYFLLGITPYLGERDFTGQRLACHSMPMYHGMGIMQTGWTATAGLTLTAFKPQSPAVAPTPDLVIKGAIDTQSDVIFCVPSFIEAWSKNPKHVELLRRTQGIMYGGGPLSQAVGDDLTEKGVSIFILYGCSELGIMNPILPKASGKDWNYFTFPEGINTRFVWDTNGHAELLLLPGKFLIPNVLNTVINGLDAYATSDLLEPHPTKPGYWRIYGRADDQIMHNTGEKTNPGPLENILNQDPHVHASVMFGRGRFNAGVIIDPRPEIAFDPNDQEKLVEFRNLIWPTVERMNEFAPQHSRLFKEMILVASPSKPFAYTAKNTARRQAIINDYEAEIEALYGAVDETTQADIPPPQIWDLPHALEFVREVVKRVLHHSVEDTDDIFQRGCDSLQATWIRNSLLHALRDTAKANTRAVSAGFVYENPTISSLAAFVSSFAKSEHFEISQDERIEKMLQMVEKYKSFGTHKPSLPVPEKDTVVITGTTGSLGTAMLYRMAKSPNVAHVYALNRKGQGSLEERQRAMLQERGFDDAILDSGKVELLEIDGEKEHLGLPTDVFEQIRASATHIIHNAWPVNFNLSLNSFEPSIKVVQDLINLALSSPLRSPPRLIFISSIGVLRNIDLSSPVKEGPVEASVAVGMGYGEAKWVAETLLGVAASQTPLRPVSIRVGQLTGGTSGAWNQAEWFPTLIRTSQSLGSLPTLNKSVSWIPVDAAAEAILELRNSPSPYLHLIHPRPVSWQTIMAPIQKQLSLSLVPYKEWLVSLEQIKASSSPHTKINGHTGKNASAEDTEATLTRYPALKILDFFTHVPMEESTSANIISSSEAMGMPRLDISEAYKLAPSLQNVPELGEKDVHEWLGYWRKNEFIP